ncbi:hypothetical protein P3T76_007062 [Phytophthora citrophthora]|uniref:Uncharacterized protein n=1 Tax=Phytophthora citrophthora TaxID=4793 RepID=A0AAD9LMB0_9STRA|nr:hypothetical protein P3T76_007062 [Phytophthora citrophthora]
MAIQVAPTPIPLESTSDHKHESTLSALELYKKMTLVQKIIIGLLCVVIALEGLYLYVLVVKYLAEWFILLLVVTKRMKQLRSEP